MIKNKVTAVLGPTNTGKTYQAIETLLSFDDGMIGFPLRLLAREVYDKVVKRIGKEKVALITGEEKIIPNNAKYYLCTVESMPIDKKLEFVAVDEIQMCSDHERGHIFTERLLNLRGEKLTMFLGSHTIKNIIENLDEDTEFIDKNRLSKLSFVGHKKISRIDRKSAIIGFSAEEVYAIAELIRRQKGGASIVMGSLSPKTRNAQVELYQSGDVDYLVATDAIGMGINMDINNVYFSNIKKFDGKKSRRLNLPEIGQIAGRAGRFLNDGFFGITGECDQINSVDVELLEGNKFEEIRNIFWRNFNLNFSSTDNLIKSLEVKPPANWLRRINECEDEKVLKFLIKDKEKYKIQNNPNNLKILWQCCQIPDFVKKTYGHHLQVVIKVFEFLSSNNGKVPSDYMKKQLKSLDNLEGNVDSLSNRIANVRTWSYVANKINWVENQDYWIERTKYLEDKLSDRLHEELTKTFIDKRASILARGLKQDSKLETKIIDQKKVIIDNQYIGEIVGLKLNLDLKANTLDTDIKSLRKAARQNIGPEFSRRISEIIDSRMIVLEDNFKITWQKNTIAKIIPGKDYLSPKIEIIVDDIIELEDQKKLTLFLNDWLENKIKETLKNLFELKLINEKNSNIRALAYRLYENNGVIKRNESSDLIKKLNNEDRKILRKYGVKFGRYHIFLFKLLKPDAVKLRLTLWKNFQKKNINFISPKFGLNFLTINEKIDKNLMLICGFENFNNLYIRIDILDRLFVKLIESNKTKNKEIKLTPEMLNLLGCNKENFLKLIELMDYKHFNRENEIFLKYTPKKKQFKKEKSRQKFINNAFNKLKQIQFK